MGYIRHAAVAGAFYPGNARDLNEIVLRLLADAETRSEPGPVPKAIIAPHAGFKYSGSVAASAYIRLKPCFDRIKRVVLIGPSHRVPLAGLGASSAKAFETPLGTIPVDTEMVGRLTALPHVEISNEGHAEEHSVEVQLPFLQCLLDAFSILPLVCNRVSPAIVADTLDRVWGGSETLIVISSDLSHDLPYAQAREVDGATCRAIETLDHEALGDDQACGHASVGGLLTVAKDRRMRVATLDLRNSGDTAGDRRRVVGYGAWMFVDGPSATHRADASTAADEPMPGSPSMLEPASLLETHGAALLDIAAASIRHGLDQGEALTVDAGIYPSPMRAPGASFVTLYHEDTLRGCIGTSNAYRPLVSDVAANAFAAAFSDHRFQRLDRHELSRLRMDLSVLSEPQPVAFTDEISLREQLCPGRDGVILDIDGDRALFLPQVWSKLPDATDFLGQLKRKAGYTAGICSSSARAWTFQVSSVSSEAPMTSPRLRA